MRIQRVDNRVYQGAILPPTGHLLGEEFDVIFQFAESKIDDPRVVYMPFEDDHYYGISDKDFWVLWGMCISAHQRQEVVLSLCQMGENRSGLASLCLLFLEGKSVDEAVQLIRREVSPNSGAPYSIWNELFIKQLRFNVGERRL